MSSGSSPESSSPPPPPPPTPTPPSPPPSTPPRSASRRRVLVRLGHFAMTLLVLSVLGFVFVVWHINHSFNAPGPLTESAIINVPKGATFSSLVSDLERLGAIPRQNVFRVFVRGVRASGRERDLRPGEFELSSGMSMREIMLTLTDGRPIQYTVTLPEGWTSEQLIFRLMDSEFLVGEISDIPPEGSLLPDTYAFERGASRSSVIERMNTAHRAAVDEVWTSRSPDLPLSSPEELVILASIVEKETGVSSERERVAGVFVNRLRLGMRLQTDPTVIYGLWGGGGKPKDRGGLRRSELDKPTPYNTYLVDGLPPGPISNPGIASLRAVANPAVTEELYFVADGAGGHVFSKTLSEHNRNVREWRRIERERRENESSESNSEVKE